MRILYLGEKDGPHDRRFLHAFSRSKHEIHAQFLFVPSAGHLAAPLPDNVQFAEWEGVDSTAWSPDLLADFVQRFRCSLDRVRPSVVHAGPIHSSAFLVHQSGFRPYASMSWGFDLLLEAERDAAARQRARVSLADSILFFCDSTAVRRQARLLAGYPDDRIVQFPWGVDLELFSPAPAEGRLRRALGWQDAFILVTARSWEHLYGVDTVLDAFRRAHDRDPRLRLLLIGSGSLAPTIHNYIAAHALQLAVHCPGFVPEADLAAYFNTADLYVSASHVDGTSVSLLQALACGLPVLVTDNASNREWIEPEINGWLASMSNAESFSAAILNAATRTVTERSEIAHRNRLLAVARADWTRHSKTLLEAYDRLERSLRLPSD